MTRAEPPARPDTVIQVSQRPPGPATARPQPAISPQDQEITKVSRTAAAEPLPGPGSNRNSRHASRSDGLPSRPPAATQTRVTASPTCMATATPETVLVSLPFAVSRAIDGAAGRRGPEPLLLNRRGRPTPPMPNCGGWAWGRAHSDSAPLRPFALPRHRGLADRGAGRAPHRTTGACAQPGLRSQRLRATADCGDWARLARGSPGDAGRLAICHRRRLARRRLPVPTRRDCGRRHRRGRGTNDRRVLPRRVRGLTETHGHAALRAHGPDGSWPGARGAARASRGRRSCDPPGRRRPTCSHQDQTSAPAAHHIRRSTRSPQRS